MPRRVSPFLLLAAVGLLTATNAPGATAAPRPAPLPPLAEPIRGMTVSTHRGNEDWARPEVATAFDDLKALGVNAVAIHPYAQVREDGHIEVPAMDPEPDYLVRPLEAARARGLGVMVIPHVAYWGTKFAWRGEINFDSDAEWNDFFADYQRWIVGVARVAQAHGAGLLCVGLEFTHAQRYEASWRAIIAAVREVYGGKLTYGGNWDSYGQVGFYDDLDYIGVLAYFPLARVPEPSEEDILTGWEQHLANLRALSKRLDDKPVLFVEIGYNESAHAASDPWGFGKGGPRAAEVQGRCVDAALRLGEREHARGLLAGMFWWKWFPTPTANEPEEEESFDLRVPGVRARLAQRWAPPVGAVK